MKELSFDLSALPPELADGLPDDPTVDDIMALPALQNRIAINKERVRQMAEEYVEWFHDHETEEQRKAIEQEMQERTDVRNSIIERRQQGTTKMVILRKGELIEIGNHKEAIPDA